MLNISENNISKHIDPRKFSSLRIFQDEERSRKNRKKLLFWVFFIIIAALFLPWTQNIMSKGYVTSLQPEKRPQNLESVISGRIEKWYVAEGDLVNKGDTILFISEIKDEYFDPRLLERTKAQLEAKKSSLLNYEEKANALVNQINAIESNRLLKLEQARNKLEMSRLKVIADSIDLVAANTNERISLAQLTRMESLFDEGLYSNTDVEKRRMKLQETTAKRISQESKLLSSKNDLLNARVEINSVEAEYQDKLAKTRSERFATLSAQFGADAEVTKLENQLSNYQIRTDNYYITAPQKGYITRAIKTGIGETIKEGEELVTIMPANFSLAVEMYVEPIDLPLVHPGENVRIQFDGWPAIFFSGWPGVSVGTFGGKVVAIDNFTTKTGLYRVLVSPDPTEQNWPKELRVGAGAKTFTLLKDVRIWYELWRRINGFPPDYYLPDNERNGMAGESNKSATK
jgi:multidrug resistance efflux pump